MKKKRQEIRKQGFFITLFKYSLVVSVMVCLGAVFVWKNIQMYEIGVSINKKSFQLETLREDNKMIQVRIASLVSPQNIKKNLSRHKLNMVLPEDSNIIYLTKK